MTMEAAEGTTSMVALRFCTVSLTVIFRPFQSKVALAMSSPIFLGDYTAREIVVRLYSCMNEVMKSKEV